MKWVRLFEQRPRLIDTNNEGHVLFISIDSFGVDCLGYLYYGTPFPDPEKVYWLDERSSAVDVGPNDPSNERYWQPFDRRVFTRAADGVTIDYSKPLGVGRYKSRVRIFTFDAEGKDGSIVGQYFTGMGWSHARWRSDGTNTNGYIDLSLVNIPREFTATLYVNFYPSGTSRTYDSREAADQAAESLPGRVACLKVDCKAQEGEGLQVEPQGETRSIDIESIGDSM